MRMSMDIHQTRNESFFWPVRKRQACECEEKRVEQAER